MQEQIETSPDREQNKATTRILSVLSLFAADASGYGVTELSSLLGMSKNMIHRALTTLVEQGYLVRDPSGQRYELGYRVLELQNANSLEPDLRALCAPYIRQLFALTGETVSLMVRAFDHAVFIDGVETRRPGTYRIEIGALRPLHPIAAGRLMLAHDPDEAIAAYIARHTPLVVPGPEGVLAPQALWDEIARTRAEGYARSLRQGPLPMLAVAFPIRDAEGGLHGALSVGGPRERFANELELKLPAMKAIAAELSRRTRLYPARSAQWELA
ncbi:MAG: IclR family transcriptional regulator [Rhodospirillales bacterium]